MSKLSPKSSEGLIKKKGVDSITLSAGQYLIIIRGEKGTTISSFNTEQEECIEVTSKKLKALGKLDIKGDREIIAIKLS